MKTTNTDDLYNLAVDHGYTVDFFPIKSNGLCIEDNGKCYIAIRPELNGVQEKETLAHELGHCEYGGFYSRFTAVDTIQRHEQKADKWAFLHLLPIESVKAWIDSGICMTWEIAEEAGVSCTFAARALEYYHSMMMI